MRCDPFEVRALGTLGVLGASWGMILGLSNARNPHAAMHFASSGFFVACAYFLLSAAGTIALRKIAAVAFAGPFAIAGVVSVGAVMIQGPLVAIVLNLLITLPVMAVPAFVVYRNWRCLR